MNFEENDNNNCLNTIKYSEENIMSNSKSPPPPLLKLSVRYMDLSLKFMYSTCR